MKCITLSICFIALSFCNVFGQKMVKVQDCKEYAGKRVTVTGTIKWIQRPGYSSSISYTIVSDSTENSLSVDIPIEVYSKSKILASDLKGKVANVYGLIKMNHDQPYIIINNPSDIEIMK